ncbi:hypothetical protein EJB05_52997, partial [Eragrostis curvula]
MDPMSRVQWPIPHVHPAHSNTFLQTHPTAFTCDACKLPGYPYQRRFRCMACSIEIHDDCGTLGETRASAAHIHHALKRIINPPSGTKPPVCAVCKRPAEGMRYWCPRPGCSIVVHPQCGKLTLGELQPYMPLYTSPLPDESKKGDKGTDNPSQPTNITINITIKPNITINVTNNVTNNITIKPPPPPPIIYPPQWRYPIVCPPPPPPPMRSHFVVTMQPVMELGQYMRGGQD